MLRNPFQADKLGLNTFMRRQVFKLLCFLARRRFRKIHPTIVGITGSAGKTSGKDLIATILERRYSVKKTHKNLNSEFGVLFTILDYPRSVTSWEQWPAALLHALKAGFSKPELYEILVLEMGVDKPGDMSKILEVAEPDIMVFLNVKNVHLGEGGFANRQEIFDDKALACKKISSTGWAVLNRDDAFVKQLIGQLEASVVTVGLEEGADLQAVDISSDVSGLHFTLKYEQTEVPVHVPKVLGECHVSSILAAIAVAFIKEVPWKAIETALADFELPNGRMNLLEGKNGSTLIDSSYNASPDTMVAALKVLRGFHGRRIAALGCMNELGDLSESEHIKIGKFAAESAHVLIAVGVDAPLIAEGAKQGGMASSMIHIFANSKDAGEFLSQDLRANDVVLIKGSESRVRMERTVKACMQNPEEARHRLVRQEPHWLNTF